MKVHYLEDGYYVNKLEKEIERLKEDNKELGRLYSRANNEFLRLYFITKEVREYIEKHIWTDSEYPYYMEMVSEDYNELLEILDKGNK